VWQRPPENLPARLHGFRGVDPTPHGIRDPVHMDQLGRWLLILGALIALLGLALLLIPRVPWVGRLPGDLSFETPRVKVYVPLATSILLSVVLTAALYLWQRLGR
jgi:hypothetical protein